MGTYLNPNNQNFLEQVQTGRYVDKTKAALIVELKRNGSTEGALKQIREKRYFDSLANWHGDILFVGVNYDADTKMHECKIERFVK